MADNEAIKRYMRQIPEDAARFEEAFGATPSSVRMTSPDVMSSRILMGEPWANELAHQERGTKNTSFPPSNDGHGDNQRNTGAPNQRDVTRGVSEALGHELSIQRRMRGL